MTNSMKSINKKKYFITSSSGSLMATLDDVEVSLVRYYTSYLPNHQVVDENSQLINHKLKYYLNNFDEIYDEIKDQCKFHGIDLVVVNNKYKLLNL